MNLNIDNVSVKDYFSNLLKITEEVRDKLTIHELKLKLAELVLKNWETIRCDVESFEPLISKTNIEFKSHEYTTETIDLIRQIKELSRKYAKVDESRENGYRD